MNAETTETRGTARWLPWLISALGIGAVVAFTALYPPASALAYDPARIVFTLFFTPFILEAICILLGILIVITINNKRLEKERADEWVYLHQIDPDTDTQDEIPEKPKRRDEESIAKIEGFLDAKMVDDAAEALQTLDEESMESLTVLLLRIRLATLRDETETAESLCRLARAAGATDSQITQARSIAP